MVIFYFIIIKIADDDFYMIVFESNDQ